MSSLFKRKGSGCCVAFGCSMRKGTNLLSEVQLFKFPKNSERRFQWELAVRRKNWKATANSQLCNLHFVTGRPSSDPLHPDYIPSVFNYEIKHPKTDSVDKGQVKQTNTGQTQFEDMDPGQGTQTPTDDKSITLSASQIQRMKRNKEKALELRKSRIVNLSEAENAVSKKSSVSKSRDSGAGFFVEDEVEQNFSDRPVVSEPAPLIAGERPTCLECNEEFVHSYLQKFFDFPVCDNCRDNDGDHCLISKTDAKKEYLLKDCDFDKREPPLKFILKKNPHNLHGNMKLYLRLQVEKRALEVFGNEEKMEELREQKEENQLKRKKKAFDKKVKALRMEVRSSLYRKTDNAHVHAYGDEVYNEEDDVYIRTCTSCGHKIEFEKM